MADTIGYDEVVRMLRGAAEKVSGHHEMLSRLDAAIGDGDHGTTMRRAMVCVVKTVNESRRGEMATLLQDVGWAIMGIDGGSTGPLLGTFFMGMSEAVGDRGALDAAALAEVFEGAVAAVRKQTKAQVGDKTMIDALVPAVEAMRAAAKAREGVQAVLANAAEAAERGAAATKDLQARFGRARNLGERSIGSPDPGATSMSLIFRGFSDGLAAGAA